MDFVDVIISVLGKSVPWTLRRYYTAERFSSLIDVQVPSQGSGFSYQSYTQHAECWFQITNRSPVDIVIDRIEAGVNLSGYGADLIQLIPSQIKASNKASIRISGILLAPPLEKIREIAKQPQVSMNLRLVVESRVRNFVYSSHISDLRNVSVGHPQ